MTILINIWTKKVPVSSLSYVTMYDMTKLFEPRTIQTKVAFLMFSFQKRSSVDKIQV